MVENNNVVNVGGNIIVFSFISIIVFFVGLLILGVYNNFLLQGIYSVLQDLIGTGVIETNMSSTISAVEGLDGFIPYLDYLWLGGFISLFLGSVVFSYNLDRKNLFETFSFSVLGIIVFVYVGSYFIQLTEWFQVEVLEKVFPNILAQLPYFSWYLDNIGIVNLVLIVLCVIANFVNLDIARFKLNKGGDNIGEI